MAQFHKTIHARMSIHALLPEHWVHVLPHMPFASTTNLKLVGARLGQVVARAQSLWVDEAMHRARLVTLAYVTKNGHRIAFVSIPTPTGYTIQVIFGPHKTETHEVERRMYVHDFPAICCKALAKSSKVWRVETYLAFQPQVAMTLPVAFVTNLPEIEDPLDIWVDSRMRTSLMQPDSHEERSSTFQRHARFFVTLRVGPVKRHRGRRARRWTKVTNVQQPVTRLD